MQRLVRPQGNLALRDMANPATRIWPANPTVPESYWLYTSSARDSARRAEAVKQHGLEGALAHLAAAP